MFFINFAPNIFYPLNSFIKTHIKQKFLILIICLLSLMVFSGCFFLEKVAL
ncbi:MAG: hypothetical protein ACD_79C01201G0001, partial [uncultured bacterium]